MDEYLKIRFLSILLYFLEYLSWTWAWFLYIAVCSTYLKENLEAFFLPIICSCLFKNPPTIVLLYVVLLVGSYFLAGLDFFFVFMFLISYNSTRTRLYQCGITWEVLDVSHLKLKWGGGQLVIGFYRSADSGGCLMP